MLNKHRYIFYKENENDHIWWVEKKGEIERGPIRFSFDKKKIYNIWTDYPWKLSREEKEIFDKEQPFWADYFKHRNGKEKFEVEDDD